MGSLTIPDGFNSLSRREQAAHYVKLGWRLQPVYAPDEGQANERGKRPRLTLQERLAQTPEAMLAWFSNGQRNNIGLIPERPNVTVDLDDKSGGASLAFFFEAYREFKTIPFVRTSGGVHFHLVCPDLPAGFQKLTSEGFLPKLNAELFCDPSGNVVMPPSIHPSGRPYVWEGSGPIPRIPWQKLVEIFRFRTPIPQGELSGEWKRDYRGDLRTLNLVELCQRLGIYGGLLDPERGMHSVRCPWADTHCDGGSHWRPGEDETVIFTPGAKTPGFDCKHTTHGKRTLKDLLQWAESQQKGIVDRHCRQTYQPRAQHPKGDDGLGQERPYIEPAEEERCPYPPVDWKAIVEPTGPEEGRYSHKALYPHDSIIEEFMALGRQTTESADSYLLGALLPMVAAMLGRRVYTPWGSGEMLYSNLYGMLAGNAGDGKSGAIKLVHRVAKRVLPPNTFIPKRLSPEAMFEQYYPEAGGNPDKLWVVDEAKVILTQWTQSPAGAQIASQMLV